ncbi:hypothetical protein [Roseateles sp. P5_E4]
MSSTLTKSTPHSASWANQARYHSKAPGCSGLTPHMSVFQAQVEWVLATSLQRYLLPAMGSSSPTAWRGMPRMMCTPKRRPMACTWAASGAKPRPPAALGKRLGAGCGRPLPSSTSGAKSRYHPDVAPASYHWMSTVAVS